MKAVFTAAVAILLLEIAGSVSAQIPSSQIVNVGSCNVIIYGSNNIIDQSALRESCARQQVKVLRERAKDGLSDYCIDSTGTAFGRRSCSIYFTAVEGSYGASASSRMLFTGRYTGELTGERPNGRGEFRVSDLVAPPTLIMSFASPHPWSKPNLFDEFQKEKIVVFEGEWVNGSFTGYGKIILPMGGIMEGQFQNCVLLEGRAAGIHDRALGLEVYFNGDRYTGAIRNGKIHGNGELVSYTYKESKDPDFPDFTLTEKGDFRENRLFTGTRTLGTRFGTIWMETFRDGAHVGTNKFK